MIHVDSALHNCGSWAVSCAAFGAGAGISQVDCCVAGRSSHGHGAREGIQAGPDPPPATRGPGRRPGCRREGLGSTTSHPALSRLNRHAATRIVNRLAKGAGITKHISPHSLRHSFITAALDAGVPLRDVQIAARHSDPRTTTRYDRARNNLDRHASCIVTAFVAGGS